MYYLIMFIATIIFSSVAWVANYAKVNSWSLYFLATLGYFISFIIFSILCIIKRSSIFSKKLWADSIKPVLILLLGTMLLNTAVSYTTPEKIGFFIGLTVIFVPIIEFILYRTKIPKLIYLSLLLAFLGNFILNFNKMSYIFNFGDFLALATSICYALSIVWISKCATVFSFEEFGFIQSIVSSIAYFILSFITHEIHSITKNLPFFPLFFYGFCYYFFANALQFMAQKRLPSFISSLILATQSIIGVIIGILFFSFKLSVPICISALLFFSSSVVGIISNNRFNNS